VWRRSKLGEDIRRHPWKSVDAVHHEQGSRNFLTSQPGLSAARTAARCQRASVPHRLMYRSKGGLLRLSNGHVALPAFVLQNKLFESDISCIRIKVRQGPVFGRPAAVHLIGNHNLAGLVDQLDQDVLSKIRPRFLDQAATPCWPSVRQRLLH
jgi:hypothetical protein